MGIHITHIHIEGFKRFTTFDLDLRPGSNLIVGDNETGKSSLLEAVGLVLTGQYDGRIIQYAIDPYMFNASTVASFFDKRKKGEQAAPPRVLIEAYLQADTPDPALASLKGTNNNESADCPGLRLTIDVASDHVEALKDYASDAANPAVVPVEFYTAAWRSFADNGPVSLRKLPLRAATIDTSLPRAQRGPNRYVSQRVRDVLTDHQLRELSLAYKKLRYEFAREPGVVAVNADLEGRGTPATTKKLTLQVDMSSRATWESSITPHLDNLPLDCAGKGEQCRVQMRLAIAGAEETQVLLIEEPENHLSHSNLNLLMDEIRNDCANRQVIIATHSAFVLNRLGVDNLKLISHAGKAISLTKLKTDTRNYFMKLPGYDTLRLILSKRSILVEGPSDELIVHRAYKNKHGRLPLENGVDVITVGSLAFKRFLEIAVLLDADVRVVTDNDGNVAALRLKYSAYMNGEHDNIKICYDLEENYPTLEAQLLSANSRELLNLILGTTHEDDDELLKYMANNKTDCALKMFETSATWHAPQYIEAAIG